VERKVPHLEGESMSERKWNGIEAVSEKNENAESASMMLSLAFTYFSSSNRAR
jgi:hypothetical protein